MYKIYENNVAKRKRYSSYESARQAVRKILRTMTPIRYKNQPFLPMAFAGYSIKKVN